MSNASGSQVGPAGKPAERWPLQWLARADWRGRLQEADLPVEVRQVIETVTVKSRLLNCEKAEVTDELIAHFEDGNLRGQSFGKLLQDFGDPLATAKLIRLGKIRNRSMFTKFGRLSAALGLGAIGAYVIAWWVFNMGRPEPSVDYLAEFNAPMLDVPEDQKAWNIYRDVWAKHGFCEGQKGRFEEIFHRDPDDKSVVRIVRVGDPGWSVAIRKLKNSQDLLDGFREGSKLPHLGVTFFADPNQYSPEDRAALYPDAPAGEPISNSMELADIDPEVDKLMSGSMFSVLLPHVQSFRSAARILVADSRWAISQDDKERVVQNIEAIMGLSQQAAEPKFLVCALVGMAVSQIGYDLIDDVLADDPDLFDDAQLARIQKAIERVKPYEMVDFSGERLSLKDIVQRVYTDDGKGDGRITWQGMEVLRMLNSAWGTGSETRGGVMDTVLDTNLIGGPVAMFSMPSRKETMQKLNDLVDQVEQHFGTPWWEDSQLDEIEEQLERDKGKNVVVASLFPTVSGIHAATERAVANRDGMRMAIAVYRFRLQHGDWPESADDLKGKWLDQIPLDRVNGEPLKYRRTSDGFQVYSVGLDGDDDEGREIRTTRNGAFQPESVDAETWSNAHDMVPQSASDFSLVGAPHIDGDFVIWPRRSDL